MPLVYCMWNFQYEICRGFPVLSPSLDTYVMDIIEMAAVPTSEGLIDTKRDWKLLMRLGKVTVF
jgi:hypothetical protein